MSNNQREDGMKGSFQDAAPTARETTSILSLVSFGLALVATVLAALAFAASPRETVKLSGSEKNPVFESVTIRGGDFKILDENGNALVLLSGRRGTGWVVTYSNTGKDLVTLGSTVSGNGSVTTFSNTGKDLVSLGASVGDGMVTTFSNTGKDLVKLTSTVDGGGAVSTFSNTGKDLVPRGHRGWRRGGRNL